MGTKKHILFSLCFSVIISVSCFSQKDSVAYDPIWDFSITAGGIIGGPCKPMYDRLLILGIGKGWDAKAINNLPLVFEVNRRVKNYLDLGLDVTFLKQRLENRHRTMYTFNIITLNPLIFYNYRGVVFLGAGPSISSLFYYQPYEGNYSGNGSHLGLGFTVKSFLKYHNLRLEAQYSYSGAISDSYSSFGYPLPNTYTNYHISNSPVAYFYVGIGFGYRLFKSPPVKQNKYGQSNL